MPYYIPENSLIYAVSNDWRVPIGVSLLYTIIVSIFSRRNAKRLKAGIKPAPSSSAFNLAVIGHNILLTAFSAYTFCAVIPLLLASFRYRPLHDSFCDAGEWVYRHGLGFWAWVFYLSKYYELIDTAILLIKGKPSSTLQTFHHAGAIMTMWMLVTSRTFSAWVFVSFNSFIHTLMYTYYTLTCLGYQPRWKKLMTLLQILQFLAGLPLCIAYIYVPGCLRTEPHVSDQFAQLFGLTGRQSQAISLIFTFVYVFALVFLFVNFAHKSYYSKQSKEKAKVADKKTKTN